MKVQLLLLIAGFGSEAGTGLTEEELKGGVGGYAGIHVPEEAKINIRGKGVLISIGGNASAGADSAVTNLDKGAGGGGRRWCWNRWKWWQRWRLC